MKELLAFAEPHSACVGVSLREDLYIDTNILKLPSELCTYLDMSYQVGLSGVVLSGTKVSWRRIGPDVLL